MRLISMLICRYPRFRGISRIAQAVGLLFFTIGRLTALDPSHAVSQYGHAAWTRADSQSPGRVLALTQTLDGTMWVGTEFGLFRFDGLTFVPWNPQGEQFPIASVTALASAQDGGLWIGTRNGVFYSREKTFQHVRTDEGTQRPGVSAILVDRAGTVWVGTAGFHSGGLCRVNATRSKCAPVDALADESIFSLFEDRGGNVWAGGTKGLYVWKSSSMQKYAAYAAAGISGIAQAFDGSIVWTDTSNSLQWFVNGKIMRYPASLRAEAHPRILLSDHEGSLWIGTMGQALMHVHQGRTDQYTRADGLSGDTVFGFFEDRERNIWVATERGLDRFRDFSVVSVRTR